MNIIADKKQLSKQLSLADSITSTRSSLPILSNVLIEGKDNKLYITSSNLETGIKVSGNVDVQEEGSIVVSGRKLLSIIRELPDSNILLKTDGNKLLVRSLDSSINAKFTLLGVDRESFPVVKTEIDGSEFVVDAEILRSMIKKVIFSISQDESKYALTGVFMEIYDGKLAMVATDGKRLALVEKGLSDIGVEDDGSLIPDEGVIVPKTALSELLKYSFENQNVSIGFSKNQIFIKYDNVSMVSNLIEGKFPDYKKIIPVDRENFFIVDRETFLNAIKRVSVLVDEAFKRVKLSILPGRMIVSTQSQTMGGAEEEIPIEYRGEDIDIALNYQYILDCLKEIDSEAVVVDFEDSERAITVKGREEKDYLNIIMPMKISF